MGIRKQSSILFSLVKEQKRKWWNSILKSYQSPPILQTESNGRAPGESHYLGNYIQERMDCSTGHPKKRWFWFPIPTAQVLHIETEQQNNGTKVGAGVGSG